MGTTLGDGFMAIIEAVTAGCLNFKYSRTQIVIFFCPQNFIAGTGCKLYFVSWRLLQCTMSVVFSFSLVNDRYAHLDRTTPRPRNYIVLTAYATTDEDRAVT